MQINLESSTSRSRGCCPAAVEGRYQQGIFLLIPSSHPLLHAQRSLSDEIQDEARTADEYSNITAECWEALHHIPIHTSLGSSGMTGVCLILQNTLRQEVASFFVCRSESSWWMKGTSVTWKAHIWYCVCGITYSPFLLFVAPSVNILPKPKNFVCSLLLALSCSTIHSTVVRSWGSGRIIPIFLTWYIS